MHWIWLIFDWTTFRSSIWTPWWCLRCRIWCRWSCPTTDCRCCRTMSSRTSTAWSSSIWASTRCAPTSRNCSTTCSTSKSCSWPTSDWLLGRTCLCPIWSPSICRPIRWIPSAPPIPITRSGSIVSASSTSPATDSVRSAASALHSILFVHLSNFYRIFTVFISLIYWFFVTFLR